MADNSQGAQDQEIKALKTFRRGIDVNAPTHFLIPLYTPQRKPELISHLSHNLLKKELCLSPHLQHTHCTSCSEYRILKDLHIPGPGQVGICINFHRFGNTRTTQFSMELGDQRGRDASAPSGLAARCNMNLLSKQSLPSNTLL